MTTTEDRHYAMGVLAAKKAMRDGTAFAAMCNQAEEVLAKETPEAEAARLRCLLKELVGAVGSMRVPQNVADAAIQVKLQLGPAYENALAALS